MPNPIAFTPRLRIEIDGQPLSPALLAGLEEVLVQQRLSLPSLCELTFIDPPQSFTPGSALRVLLDNQTIPLFVGHITAAEYLYETDQSLRVAVRGYDTLHRLRGSRRARAHVQVTLADLLREFSGENVVAQANSPLWDHLIQYGQSDFELVQTVAERSGLHFIMRDHTLYVLTLAGLDETVALQLGGNLYSAQIDVSGSAAPSSVVTVGWETGHARTHTGQASQSRSTTVRANAPGGQAQVFNQGVQDILHAEAIAQGELDTRAAGEVVLRGVAEGDVALWPGVRVALSGVVPAVAGQYVLTAVTHRITGTAGYICEISTAPPPLRHRTGETVTTVGQVTQINDPEGLGRVRVALPTYGNIETAWIGVLSAGAGSKKGLLITPAVGDQVLVLFVHHDPGQSIVLGGLYGSNRTPEQGVENGAVSRFSLVTPGGHVLRLDDGNQLIRIENTGGSYIELAPGGVTIHASADLTIEAPGRTMTIRANAVNFVQG